MDTPCKIVKVAVCEWIASIKKGRVRRKRGRSGKKDNSKSGKKNVKLQTQNDIDITFIIERHVGDENGDGREWDATND